jgi:hypothetical protein
MGGDKAMSFGKKVAPLLVYCGGTNFTDDGLHISFSIKKTKCIQEFRVQGLGYRDDLGNELHIQRTGFGECKMGLCLSIGLTRAEAKAKRVSGDFIITLNGFDYKIKASFKRVGNNDWEIIEYPKELSEVKNLAKE